MAPYVKGGIWSNAEDEVLKAGIAKYGLNQWGRVSTLLNQKTAKQCKARWYEWLDPSVRKSEWSRDEDERLLTLVRLMPSQWKSIAPIVGRTAAQCIERYQKLLMDSENKDSGLSLTTSDEASSAGKLRAGDIDPMPEVRPARPDAVDMDEDEKEMLAEARARLANTQGKKAKRRDRERLLEESHRLALIQKRRELKAPGTGSRPLRRKKNKKGEIDYANEIPFEHKPLAGIFDTSEEQDMNKLEKLKFNKMVEERGLQMGGGDKKRKKENDSEKKQSAVEQAAEARALKLQQMDLNDQLSKRRKLDLPEPKLDGEELDQVIKRAKKERELAELYGDGEMSGTIIQLKDSLDVPTSQFEDDSLHKKMQDLRNLTDRGSALLGNEDQPLNDESFRMPGEGPVSHKLDTSVSSEPVVDDAARRKHLREMFAALPKPKNDFEIVLPDEDGLHEDESDQVKVGNVNIDRGELEREEERKRQLEEEKAFKRKSQAIQRGLPLPDTSIVSFDGNTRDGSVQHMILSELEALIISDRNKLEGRSDLTLLDLDDDLKSAIDEEIEREVRKGTEVATKPRPLLGLAEYDEDVVGEVTNALTSSAGEANKLEKRLGLIFGGYVKRRSTLAGRIDDAYDELQRITQEANLDEQLEDMERAAIESRTSALQSEVEFLTDHERAGQERYRYLQGMA